MRSGPLAALPCLTLLLGCSPGTARPPVSGPTAPKLEAAATEMRFTPSRIAVRAGEVPVLLRNDGVVIHDLRIEEKPSLLIEAAPGETSTATWPLGKGRYQFYCSVPGHRSAGMEGLLEVR